MRTAKAKDHWNTVYKRNYEYSIEKILLNSVGGINNIELNKGIFALCGLNGAGKSTIISCLKDVLGIEVNKRDLIKINGGTVEAYIRNQQDSTVFQNTHTKRFRDNCEVENNLYYVDYEQPLDILTFFEQDNLGEFLEQYEAKFFTREEIEELNYLVGKQYSSIELIEVENGDLSLPFFRVTDGLLNYDSLSMGIGEHFLFYLYWVLEKINGSGIVLIEEPETFISITSQSHLMNHIAKKTSLKGLNLVIATHSPHIIKKIKRENICIISRYQNRVSIQRPAIEQESLITLGMELPQKGCIFVEDLLAEYFLKTIFSKKASFISYEYGIEKVNGESEITELLSFPTKQNFKYKLIGVYDGDMKLKESQLKSVVNWDFLFLPVEIEIEKEFRQALDENLEAFCSTLGIHVDTAVRLLSRINGEEHHDWFIELSKALGKDYSVIIDVLFNFWESQGENKRKVEIFVEDITAKCM
jgi:predicted ATPase